MDAVQHHAGGTTLCRDRDPQRIRRTGLEGVRCAEDDDVTLVAYLIHPAASLFPTRDAGGTDHPRFRTVHDFKHTHTPELRIAMALKVPEPHAPWRTPGPKHSEREKAQQDGPNEKPDLSSSRHRLGSLPNSGSATVVRILRQAHLRYNALGRWDLASRTGEGSNHSPGLSAVRFTPLLLERDTDWVKTMV